LRLTRIRRFFPIFRQIFAFMEARASNSEIWKNHHLATIRKVRNRLGNISVRAKGLVTDDVLPSDLPWGKFADPSLMPSTFGEGGTPTTSPRVAPFQGQRPQQGGAPFSFQSRFPEYDFFKRPELPYGQG
jgi:hypothetical protein